MPKTKVTKANTTSPSLRATIPQAVVESLDLEHGDAISWVLRNDKGKMVAVVTKA